MNRNRCAAATLLCALVLAFAGTPVQGAETAAAEVVAARRVELPNAPEDGLWSEAPTLTAQLLLQDMVDPQLLEPSTDRVKVQAFTDGSRIAFRLEWDDATKDDLPDVARYSDACAIQLPASSKPDVPAPQMGDPDGPVHITYWRAFWQSTVEGREDTIKALYPDAAVDHYPFEAPSLQQGSEVQQEMAKRYAPARALGNTMAGPRERPVQDLIARGPGTLQPAAKAESQGQGVRTDKGWSVVLSRPVPKGIEAGSRTQVAVAIWEGSRHEAGARKMRTAWIPLLIGGGE